MIYGFTNAAAILGDQFLGALVNGFQAGGIAIYEGLVNRGCLDGLNFNSLGYEPILDMTRTTLSNNGRTITVNVHGKGLKEAAKAYTASFLKLYPFKANISENSAADMIISSQLKARIREYFEN